MVPRGAQIIYQIRLRERAKRFRLKNDKIRLYVHQKLEIGWTPEIIPGRLRVFDPDNYVCPESIYQYIYCLAPELIEYLPRKHKRRRVKHPYRTKTERIKDREPIAVRPLAADTREEYGHWESDTIVSGDLKHVLNVLIDRKSRVVHITLLNQKTARETTEAIIRRLQKYPENFIRSITYDNGSETTQHQVINE